MKILGFPEFVWIWNKHQGLDTPAIHLVMAKWLSKCWTTNKKEMLLEAFRSSGKSTIVGLFCAWLLRNDPRLRILVLSGDFALAQKMVRNAKRIIEAHPFTAELRPSNSDQWASAQFTVCRNAELRDPSMLAKGIMSNITGLRADVIICDDVEVPNTSDTPQKRNDLRTRLREIEYVLVSNGVQLYVGTPHAYHSIYSKRPNEDLGETSCFLEGFDRLELPLLDDDGNSAWPERFPIERIEAIRRRTGPRKFDSQMLLRPTSLSECRLDPDRLKAYDWELVHTVGNHESILTLGARRLVSASCWWDPSFGSPKEGDRTVVAALFTDDLGEYWLHRVCYLQHDPALVPEVDEATQLCRQVMNIVRDLYLPAISIETNGVGRFLPGLLRQLLRTTRTPCAVVEQVSVRNKALRIIDAFDAVLAAGRLNAHRSVWQTPFIEEMREWRPGAKVHDDGLDAVAGCLLSEPVRIRQNSSGDDAVSAPNAPAWRSSSRIHTVSTDFDL